MHFAQTMLSPILVQVKLESVSGFHSELHFKVMIDPSPNEGESENNYLVELLLADLSYHATLRETVLARDLCR